MRRWVRVCVCVCIVPVACVWDCCGLSNRNCPTALDIRSDCGVLPNDILCGCALFMHAIVNRSVCSDASAYHNRLWFWVYVCFQQSPGSLTAMMASCLLVHVPTIFSCATQHSMTNKVCHPPRAHTPSLIRIYGSGEVRVCNLYALSVAKWE